MKLSLICLLISFNLLSQEGKQLVTTGIRYNRLDFFIEQHLIFKKELIQHEFGSGLGMNRTIFQDRLFPEFSYILLSNLKYERNFDFQLFTAAHFSFYNPNKMNREFHFFNEFLAGFYFAYGAKIDIFFQADFGLLQERFHSDFFEKKLCFSTLTYSSKIGLKYEI